jgi:hypothetical protein
LSSAAIETLAIAAPMVAGGLAIYGAGILRDRRFDFGRMLGLAAIGLFFCPLFLLAVKARKHLNGAASAAIPLEIQPRD